MRREVLLSSAIQSDQTPLPTLGRVTDRGKDVRLWCYLGHSAHRHSVFEHATSRGGRWPQRWLKDFQGHLHTDAYADYPALGRNCWRFAGTTNGGEATAPWLTVIQRAQLREAEPFAYVSDFLKRMVEHRDLPAAARATDGEMILRGMLSDAWISRHPATPMPLAR